MRMNDDINNKCKILPNRIIDMLVTVAKIKVLQILYFSEKEGAREVKHKTRLLAIKHHPDEWCVVCEFYRVTEEITQKIFRMPMSYFQGDKCDKMECKSMCIKA